MTHGGVDMDALRLATAKQMFLDGEIDKATLDGYLLRYGGDPVSIGASTAVVEPPKAETKVCNKCKDGSKDNHAPSCPYKGMTDEGIELAKLKASIANGEASIPPAQGLELVETFEVPFQKATDGVYNLYGWTTEECKADNTRKFGKYYSHKLQFATGRKLKVTYEVVL